MHTDNLDCGIILHELSNIGMVIHSGASVLTVAAPGSREAVVGQATLLNGARRLNETLVGLRALLGRADEMPEPGAHSVLQLALNYAGEVVAWQGRDRPINVTADHEHPEFIVPELLRLVLRNFLANSLRYSPEGVPIDVRIRHSATETRVLVRNHGPQIPDDVRAHLFSPGGKGPDGGSGLGLHIALRAAQAMHGRVACVSHRRQTAFSVVFPTRRAVKYGSRYVAA